MLWKAPDAPHSAVATHFHPRINSVEACLLLLALCRLRARALSLQGSTPRHFRLDGLCEHQGTVRWPLACKGMVRILTVPLRMFGQCLGESRVSPKKCFDADVHFCPRPCSSTDRWAKLTTHRHRGPHSVARAPTPPFVRATATCAHVLENNGSKKSDIFPRRILVLRHFHER